MSDKNITISRNEFISLKKDSEKLRLLENGGVDNWEWYGESLWPDYSDGENYDDIIEAIEKEYK